MTNSTFHKLCYEFDLNYKWQTAFQQYCDSLGIIYINMYGNPDAKTVDMKNARDYWKKTHKLWLQDCVEVDIYIDNMPFGDYADPLDAHAIILAHRKAEREKHKTTK